MLSNLLEDLRNTSKPKRKQSIVLSYDSKELRELVRLTYDPFEMFHIKLKKPELPEPGGNDIIDKFDEVKEFLKFCLTSNSPKQNREHAFPIFSELLEGSQELLFGVLNKNWKVGLGTKSILKIYPGIVPEFDVQLANKYSDYIKKKDYKPQKWYSTPKLDGVRCIAIRNWDRGTNLWSFVSRQGKLFKTVDHISPQLEEVYNRAGLTLWDGELYKHGLDFEEIQGMVMGFTQGTAYDVEFHTFVGCKKEDFFKQSLNSFVLSEPEMFEGLSHIEAVDLELIDEEDAYEKLDKAFSEDYEGIMLRDPSKLYAFKRSDALIKLKKSENDDSQEEISDCLVVDVEYKKDFPIIENEKIVYKNLINKLIVEQKNEVLCKVGSGYTLSFRNHYTNYPEEIVGKVVEVEHQGYGKNNRMRFPRLHRIREDITWQKY